MSVYLGIDIGTFESKGVLVDGQGVVLASSARPHKMLVPEPGFAEHRPEEDWWGDFAFLAKDLLAQTKLDPKEIRCVAVSAIGPCMLPVDAAVLYRLVSCAPACPTLATHVVLSALSTSACILSTSPSRLSACENNAPCQTHCCHRL